MKLNKLEYSFNSIERIGTPGVTGGGQPNPSVKLKVDRDIVTNISYYFDPSRTGSDSPVIDGSYLDVVGSPYEGSFTVTGTSGATITRGADTMRFPLVNEPEGNADVINAFYSTASELQLVLSMKFVLLTKAVFIPNFLSLLVFSPTEKLKEFKLMSQAPNMHQDNTTMFLFKVMVRVVLLISLLKILLMKRVTLFQDKLLLLS